MFICTYFRLDALSEASKGIIGLLLLGRESNRLRVDLNSPVHQRPYLRERGSKVVGVKALPRHLATLAARRDKVQPEKIEYSTETPANGRGIART
ncbi:hypothetical protein [Dankookia rubra]|uniref:hypothetical protein n=1 Tax=Dankookia rubra TaxID=1442381 RepID=UPI00140D6BC5|nr:hypothetical protein [Dankookia rubra]